MKKIYTLFSARQNDLSKLIVVLLISFFANAAFSQTVVVNPPSPWTVPAGVTSVKVEVWGAGGGGGTGIFGYGGGGGGGAFKTATFTVVPTQQYTLTIGTGGGSDADGGLSKFTGAAGTITANGGSAGEAVAFDLGNGGNGGTGDFNGGNGQYGGTTNQYGGGGAGNNGNGGNSGTGGAGSPNMAPYKGGSGGSNGNNGNAPGGGGGGGGFFGSGASGGKGQIVLTYTVGPSAPSITSFSPATVCAGSGTVITITGTNFTSTPSTTVTFSNNIAVTATYVNATTVKAALPAGAVTGPLKVSNTIGSDISSTDLIVNTPNVPLTVTGAGTGFCESTVISASGGGGGIIYFQGTNAAGTSIAAQSPQTVSTVGTNTYYFRELSACGWGTAYPVTVGINPAPSAFTVNVTATCSSAVLTPSGAAGDIFYFEGNTMGGTSTATPGQVTVNAAGTYYYRARTAQGCWGADKAVTVVFAVTASITSQPVSKAVCTGTNTSFSVMATSGTGLSYQWRKGTVNITGATSSVLNFTPATAGDAGTDYNCVVTDACGSLISDYVSLTVNAIATAPTSQATALVFPSIGVTSVVGIFTASPTATNYIVVRSLTNTLGSSPANGNSYAVGGTNFGANTYIEYIGPDNSFTSSGLNPGTTYYYFVFAFNINTCSGTDYPLYKLPALSGPVTTATSTTCATRPVLYWAGTGSAGTQVSAFYRDNDFQNKRNWSTTYPAYTYAAAFPTKCNDVVITLNSNVNIGLSDDAEFYNLTFKVTGNNVGGSLITKTNNLTVYGNAVFDITSGNANTLLAVGENNNTAASTIDFKANVDIGATNTNGTCYFYGNQNSRITVRGDLKLGATFALYTTNINTNVPGTLLLDGTAAQQVTWNNSKYYARFNNVTIGSTNSPIVSFSTLGSQIPDNILGDLTINNASVLTLGLKQWNNNTQGGGTFTMSGTSKLQLAGTSSVANGGSASLAAGSNFPSGFSYAFTGASTVEYNGKTDVTQIIYNIPSYKNLTLTNGSGLGTANKNNAAAITVTGTGSITNGVTHTMNAGIINNGTFNISSGAALLTGAQFMTGNGAFNLNSGGTIGIGDASGITTTATGAVGNIRSTGTRSYNAGATYIYNGANAQFTGNGLPSAANVLTIQNANGVTITGTGAAYSPATYNQTTGPLALNGNTLVITSIVRNSGTISGSETSGITINGTSIPLFMTSPAEANMTLKTLTLNASKTANINTALNITGGLSAGNAGAVILGSGATLTTADKLVLKSNKFGTAYVDQLPVNGSGVALAAFNGKVSVERYINTGTAAGTHGKSWQLLATPTSGQTIRDAWQEAGVYNPGYGIEMTANVYTSGNHHGYDAYTAGPSLKTYNSATDQYDAVPNTDLTALANAKGYYVYIRGDRSVTSAAGNAANATNLRSKGTLYTGTQPAVTIPAGKYGTVGNPYAAPVDLRVLRANSQNVTNDIYIWDPALGGSYASGGFRTLTWINSTVGYRIAGYNNSGTYPGPYVDTMQSGQAFFVKSNGIGTTTVTFTENAKVSGQANGHLVNDLNPPAAITVGTLDVSLSGTPTGGGNTQFLDGALAIFGEGYSNGLDQQDGAKISNGSNNVGFLQGGKFLSVERRQLPGATDTLSLHLTNSKVQAYSWNFAAENINVPGLTAYLWDKYLNTKTPLSLNSSTNIDFSITSVAASAAADRFKIVFGIAKPLPVTLVSVSAKRNTDKTISVNWQTANEINLQQFVIERSSNGSSFETLGNQAVLNNNGGGSNYVYADNAPLPADNYYRIRSVSKDGGVQYSPVVKVEALQQDASISVYPNPVVNRQMYISFVNQPKGIYTLELINKLGQVMYKGTVNVAGNLDKKKVSLVNVAAGGAYQLVITAKDGTVHTVSLLINND